jgi:hypothetical protein
VSSFENLFRLQITLIGLPESDPFKQRTALVFAGLVDAVNGIEMEVGIDEGRRHKSAASVNPPTLDGRFLLRLDRLQYAIGNREPEQTFSVGKVRVANSEEKRVRFVSHVGMLGGAELFGKVVGLAAV